MMRRIGVDPGSKRIGLALSEPDISVAYPYKTIQHEGLSTAAVLVSREVHTLNIDEIVVGFPLRTDGSEGLEAHHVRKFAESVEDSTKVTVVLWDERLSTASAHRALAQAQVYGKKRRQVVDQVAAVMILQSYLDSKRGDLWIEETLEENPVIQNLPKAKKNKRRARNRKR